MHILGWIYIGHDVGLFLLSINFITLHILSPFIESESSLCERDQDIFRPGAPTLGVTPLTEQYPLDLALSPLT